MDYTIELSDDQKFFRVRAMGPVTTGIARRWSADLKERSRALNIRKYLIDVRSVSNVSSVVENYHFAYEDSEELGLKRNIRVAILISEGDRSHDFAETAMRNAGFNVRIFTDESSAVKWLEEET